MTSFATLIDTLQQTDGAFAAEPSADWLQGRTAFGGLSGALCVEAALRGVDDLPPLRSAQFAFIGPAAGPLRIEPAVLRRGKSSAFVSVDLTGEAGLAVRALLCFAADRPSQLAHVDLAPPPVLADREALGSYFEGGGGPNFSQHFETRLIDGDRPVTGSRRPSTTVWIRHEPATPDSLVGLLAIADAIPAPGITMYRERAPLSTMTWSVDILSQEVASDDGWWLLRSVADTAVGGYSSQTMHLWGAGGRPVIAARQMVALFY